MSANATKYVGLDLHKKSITYCIKKQDGQVIDEGSIQAARDAITEWLDEINGPWIGAMEATLFTGWIYDFLIEHADELKVAHPQMLKAIGASKKKNDKIDAAMIADLLRVNLLPECWMAWRSAGSTTRKGYMVNDISLNLWRAWRRCRMM